jgi:hypothetical protein
VHLYLRGADGWRHTQRFFAPPHAGDGDRFGHAIDFKGDTVVVGTPNRGALAHGGATYIFERAN